MTDYGVTPYGFVLKRLETIRQEIEDSFRSVFGTGVNLTDESDLGQIVGILSERESLTWELAEAVYNSQYPPTAQGVPLDNIVSITGITRNGATKSRVIGQRLFGTVGTPVPSGTVFSVSGDPTARFVTSVAATLIAGTNCQQTTTFSLVPTSGSWKIQIGTQETGLLAFNATAATVQTAVRLLSRYGDVVVTGDYTTGFLILFTGSQSGLQPQPLIVVDHTLLNGATPVTVTQTMTVPGVSQAEVDLLAETAGDVQAPAFSLTVIETPVSGLSATINPLDAVRGQNVETDAELKARRETSLERAGSGTVNAIRAALLDLDDVRAVVVFENDSDVTVDGTPPHCLRVVVEGGDEDLIAATLFEVKAAGIGLFGSITKTVNDSQGFAHTIKFSRPSSVNVYLEADLTTNAEFPTDGVTQAQAAFLAAGNELGIGADVIAWRLLCALDSIPGIDDVVLRIGTAPGPTTDDNIVIDPDEISAWDSSRITVVEV